MPPLNAHNVAGRYKYGPTPGSGGSSVILGHVGSYKGISVFFYIKSGGPFDYQTRNYVDNIVVYAHLSSSVPA